MNEITHKHLFITMIIIGVITIGLLIPRYGTRATPYSYSYGNTFNPNTLSATAYNVDYSGAPTNSFLNLGSRQPYQAVINKSYYPISGSTTTYTSPSSSYYYTTTESTSYDQSYYYDNSYQGYLPPGCNGGNDYSLTTGEPCG
jgi:hypothetical protein